jgi:RNA polymerase sigma-70 factor (ECF subfamily)
LAAIDLDAWYRRYAPMVLRRCAQLLRDEPRAVEAMHDVFVQILRRKDSIDGQSPAALLHRTATNVCLNHLRSQRRRPEDAQDQLVHEIAASAEDPESLLSMRSLLARIFGHEPESTRTMAVLHLVDGMTLEEVAGEVGLSVSGVRKRLRTLKARVAALQEV